MEENQTKQTSSAKTGETVNVSKKDTKLLAAVSCIPIVGLVMFFVEKEDKRVRFYAAQGILIGIVGILLSWIPVINFFVWIVEFVVVIVVALKAYQTDEFYKLPVIGDFAERWANQ